MPDEGGICLNGCYHGTGREVARHWDDDAEMMLFAHCKVVVVRKKVML